MANVTDSASLLTIPSGWSDGVLGSLKPDDGTGDFTFSRGSDLSATRVNKNGYIEKGYENLVLQSNSFDLSPWGGAALREGSQAGYDGTNNAWLITKTGSFGSITQTVDYSGIQSFSAYLKAGDSTWVRITRGGKTMYFDLANGGAGSFNTYSAIGTPYMESVGNGWYRCIWTLSPASTNLVIYPAESDGDASGTSGSIYIQGVQVNQGTAVYPYVESAATAAKSTTIFEDQPRIDHNGNNGFILIEPQQTNIVPWSEYMTPILSYNTYNYNTETSPEGYRNATTLKLGIDASPERHRSLFNINAETGKYYTFSVFFKEADAQWIQLLGQTSSSVFTANVYANFELRAGYKSNVGTDVYNADIINYGNGWYRCSITAKSQAAGTGYFEILTTNNADSGRYPRYQNTVPLDYVYLYGAQIEQGKIASSYIPTYGTTSTRLKETATLAKNVASTGTIYININSNSTKTLTFLGGNVSVIKGTNKIAMAYSPTALKISHNGTIVQNITRTFDTSALTQIQLGHRNNFEQTTDGISQFLTLDSFLSDADLNELTA